MPEAAMPTVSVVIPTYNRAHLILDAAESVRAQDWPALELIVVDDGSDDGTEQRVTAWRDHVAPGFPVRYLRQPRLGGNAARNRGIAEAEGEYVAFLDSDDVWHAGKIARQVALLETRPDHGAVYTGLREVDAETGAVLATPAQAFPQGDLLDALLVRDVTAPTSTYLVRRALLLETGGFDTALEARQDWDMWIRLAARARIGCIPAPLVDLRQHSGPRTASDPTRELRAYRQILEKYAPLRRTRGPFVRLAALAAYHRRAGRVQLRYLGNRGRAMRHYLTAIALWPVAPDSWAALLGALLPGGLRRRLRAAWNRIFGRTPLAIRSH